MFIVLPVRAVQTGPAPLGAAAAACLLLEQLAQPPATSPVKGDKATHFKNAKFTLCFIYILNNLGLKVRLSCWCWESCSSEAARLTASRRRAARPAPPSMLSVISNQCYNVLYP